MNREKKFTEEIKQEKKMQIVPDYRKKAFYEGCVSFEDVFNRMSECGFTKELIELYKGSIDKNRTEAIIYHNVYITPCMIDGMLDTFKTEYKINNIKTISNNIVDTLKRGYSLYECEELEKLNLI